MNQTALISIIIPVYNAEDYLSYCVNSVLKQSYPNFELLLIDDGSKDSSSVLCDSFAKKDKRVIVVHTENRGVSHARNMGLSLAKGEYILFVDNDDVLPSNAVEKYLSAMNKGNVDIVQGKVGSKKQKHVTAGNGDYYQVISIEEYVKDSNYKIWVWGKMYKASIAKKYCFPEGHYCEDIYYNAMYLTDPCTKSAGIIDIYTYLRYDNPSSASHQWNEKIFLDNIRMVDHIYRKVKQKTDNRLIRDRYIRLLFTLLCKNKYNIILRKKYNIQSRRIVRNICNKNIRELWESGLSVKEKTALSVFSKCNYLFRIWLLHIDPTMKIYENGIKATL